MNKMKKKPFIKRHKYGITQTVLSLIVIIVLVARFIRHDYYSVFLCVLTLLLFNIPFFVDKTFNVRLTKELEIIILLFVFSAEILGEIGNFYTRIPWWDTMLHTTNGFLMAAIGFSMIDVLNNSPKFHFNLSPIFVAFVALCFSMTIGVLWEFFEYGMDTFTASDMQKDDIVKTVSSVALNPEGENDPVILDGIEKTVVYFADGGEACVIEGGYLDTGLKDTMKDMIVNFIGAVIFSIIGCFYLMGRNKGIFASRFIPQLKTAEEIEKDKKEKTERKQGKN